MTTTTTTRRFFSEALPPRGGVTDGDDVRTPDTEAAARQSARKSWGKINTHRSSMDAAIWVARRS